MKENTATTIIGVTCRKVFIPFKQEVHWTGGTRPGTTRLVVEIETESGIIGLGETICLLEFIEPVLAKTIAPLVIGEDACNVEKIYRKIEGAGYYHHKRAMVMALTAIEMACWDIIGKNANMPLYNLWGGKYRQKVGIVAYLQSGSIDHIAKEAAEHAERGFDTVKLKIGEGEKNDVELVRAVREAVGPDIKIRADVNGGWTIGTAKRQLKKMEPYDLEYIEQPLPLEDLAGHALLRKSTSVPIALDESAYILQDVHEIIRNEAADMILLDPHEAGGLTQARKQAALCEAAGMPVTLHSGAELGISLSAYLHFAVSVQNLSLSIDCQYHNISDDIISEPFDVDGPFAEPPSGPGLGVELVQSQVERYESKIIPNPYMDPTRPDWFTVKPGY